MTKFRMLKTVHGVHDGDIYPTHFEEGTEHDIGDSLASQFIDLGVVEMLDEDETDEEGKSRGAAPSNKAKTGAPSNKGKKAEKEEPAKTAEESK